MTAIKALNILCIEDNPGEARLIERNLIRAGHSMTLVRRGIEGLRSLKTKKYDLVLIDQILPDMTGLTVLQKILEWNPLLPAVMVTGHGDEETAVSAMKLGAKDYIIKDANSGFTELLPAVIEHVYSQYTILLEKQKAEKATKNREAILASMAQIAEQLLKSHHWQNSIEDIMAQLGKAANVTRICIVENENRPGQDITVKTCYEWLTPKANYPKLSITYKTYENIGLVHCVETLKSGQPVFGQIKASVTNSQTPLDSDWPRSYVLMPISTDSNWWGFISFDDENIDRVWEHVEVEALKMAANIIGAALQRQLTETTLYQAQKLESIGLLAGGIAHDFNNLLTSILAQTSLSLYKIPADSESRGNINMAIQAAEQAADLVKQLLGYAGQGRYQLEPVSLNQLIRENSGLFHSISNAKVKFHFNLSPNLPAIEADRSQIQQVVMNLVINATEAIQSKDGFVSITTDEDKSNKPIETIDKHTLQPGNYVCLSVKDSGEGMRQETIDNIFDPFFTTKSTGRGLGLSATLGIVRTHGGGLQVESTWQQGSEFRVYLPVSQKTTQLQTATSAFSNKIDGTILIIDDEQAILEPIREGLEMVGATILLAESGRHGVEIYEQNQQTIDLVILDMNMPDLDGRQTFLHLQKINPDIQVILSSGYAEMETIRQFEKDEVLLFLKKPYRLEKLIAEINVALHQIQITA